MRVFVMENERLTPQRKMELVQGFVQAENVTEYAASVGIDRSYLYELHREAENAMLSTWSQKTVGRPSQPEPDPIIAKLRAELKEMDEKAKVWEVRARAADLIINALDSAGVVKKTASTRPIFWRA